MVTLQTALQKRREAEKQYRQALLSNVPEDELASVVENWSRWFVVVSQLRRKVYIVKQLEVGEFDEIETTVDGLLSTYGRLESVKTFIDNDHVPALIHIDHQPVAIASTRTAARLRLMDYLIQQSLAKRRVR